MLTEPELVKRAKWAWNLEGSRHATLNWCGDLGGVKVFGRRTVAWDGGDVALRFEKGPLWSLSGLAGMSTTLRGRSAPLLTSPSHHCPALSASPPQSSGPSPGNPCSVTARALHPPLNEPLNRPAKVAILGSTLTAKVCAAGLLIG